MDGIGFVISDSLGVLASIAFILVSLALLGWFGSAVGSAINHEDGEFPGMLIGIAVGVYLIFFA
jgi:hypothetical protein